MEMNGGMVHRISSWLSILALMAYALYIGQWVGQADEKFEDHDKVEEHQKEIKEKLIELEAEQKHASEKAEIRDQAILDAIKRLEEKIDEE